MHCDSCRYFQSAPPGQPGECRRYPPKVFSVMAAPQSHLARPGPQQAQLTFVGAHPPINPTHWCGEYQRKLSS